METDQDPTQQTSQSDASKDDASFDHTSRHESAELLRLTIPLISRHGPSFEPIPYSVWYEYARGGNTELKTEIDRRLADAERIDEEAVINLYDKFVAGEREKNFAAGSSGLLGVLKTVNSSVEGATNSTMLLDSKLSDHAVSIEGISDEASFREHVAMLQADVTDVKGSLMGLSQNLRDSRDEIDRLTQELSQARAQARIDALSGLLNRRGFDQELNEAIGKLTASSNRQEMLALVVFDIDRFKSINDNHGHISGDKVIQTIGHILYQGVMRKDRVSRIGGEEFAIILPATDAVGAMAVADRLRQEVRADTGAAHRNGALVETITVSGGVSVYKRGESAADFVNRADNALYQAKQNGRDQICLQVRRQLRNQPSRRLPNLTASV